MTHSTGNNSKAVITVLGEIDDSGENNGQVPGDLALALTSDNAANFTTANSVDGSGNAIPGKFEIVHANGGSLAPGTSESVDWAINSPSTGLKASGTETFTPDAGTSLSVQIDSVPIS